MATLLEVTAAYDDMEALSDKLSKIALELERDKAHYDKMAIEWEMARAKWINLRMDMIGEKEGSDEQESAVVE